MINYLKKNKFYISFWAVIILGIGLRVYYMVAPVTKLSADEAVYGVQALNILHGERSIFYYNQNYTGTLTAFITAILFYLFGIQTFLVKLPVLLFAIGFLFTNYYLGKIVFQSRFYGLLVLGLTSITSPFWINWTTRTGSGYPETMLLGNLIFILLLTNIYEKKSLKFQYFSFFGMGFLGGLGYWIQPTIIYYLIPASILIFFWNPKIFIKPHFYLGVIGFLFGSLPVIIFNINHQNLNTQSLFHKPFGVKKAFIEFFTVGLPIIFGLRKPFSTVDFYFPLTIVVSLTYLFAFGWAVVDRLKALLKTFTLHLFEKSKRGVVSIEALVPFDLMLLFLGTVLLVFSLSSPFNQFVSEPRYISPLYTALPILIVYLVRKLAVRSRPIAVLIYLVILGSQAFGLTQMSPDSFQGPVDLRKTIERLDKKGITYVDTHAYLSYRLILETGGRVIAATRDNPPIEARYPQYRKQVDNAPIEAKGILIDHQQPLAQCASDLTKQLGPCVEERMDNGLFLYTWR